MGNKQSLSTSLRGIRRRPNHLYRYNSSNNSYTLESTHNNSISNHNSMFDLNYEHIESNENENENEQIPNSKELTIEDLFKNNHLYLFSEKLLPIDTNTGKEDLCVICQEKKPNVKLNCDHICMCYQCAYNWLQQKEKATCPLCREPVEKITIHYKLEFDLCSASRSLQ